MRSAGAAPIGGRSSGPEPFSATLLQALAGLALAFCVFVYLPLGLAAVSVQDGWTEEMRAGLGSAAPLPLRAFGTLQAWLPEVLLALSLAGLGQALLSRWLRRWSIVPPLLLLALLAFALLSGLADRSLRGLSSLSPGVILAAASLALVVVLGTILARGLRSRRFVFALVALGLLLVALRIGADAWGHVRLAAYDAGWAREAAAEQARRQAVERAVLGGPARDGDAGPSYQAVLDALRPVAAASAGMDPLYQAARAAPLDAMPYDALRAVVQQEAVLDSLRDAQRDRYCTLGTALEPARAGPAPIWRTARWIVSALVVDGHVHAQAGDTSGAAARYLAAVRFAGDVSQGPLVNALMAMSLEEVGLRAVGRLVLSGTVDAATVSSIDEARGHLEATRASIADGWRANRLLLGHMEATMDAAPQEAGLQTPRLLPWVVPYRGMAAVAVSEADRLQRRLQEALDRDDAIAWREAADAARSSARSSANPMLRAFMGYSGPFADEGSATGRLFLTARRGLAWFRLVQAATLIEGGSPGEPRLPEDPLAPGTRLHWARDAAGTRIWSVGVDERDDGGVAENEKDLVLVGRRGIDGSARPNPSDRSPGHRLVFEDQLLEAFPDRHVDLAKTEPTPGWKAFGAARLLGILPDNLAGEIGRVGLPRKLEEHANLLSPRRDGVYGHVNAHEAEVAEHSFPRPFPAKEETRLNVGDPNEARMRGRSGDPGLGGVAVVFDQGLDPSAVGRRQRLEADAAADGEAVDVLRLIEVLPRDLRVGADGGGIVGQEKGDADALARVGDGLGQWPEERHVDAHEAQIADDGFEAPFAPLEQAAAYVGYAGESLRHP
jgi:hypothetical protein